jgi:hypothetical protein
VQIDELTRDYCEHEVHLKESDKNYFVKGKLFPWGTREARIQYISG